MIRGAQDKRGKPGLAAQQTASSKSVFSKSGKKRDTKMVAKQVAAERGNYRFVKSFNKAQDNAFTKSARVGKPNQSITSPPPKKNRSYTKKTSKSPRIRGKDVGAIERKGLLIF